MLSAIEAGKRVGAWGTRAHRARQEGRYRVEMSIVPVVRVPGAET